MTTPKRRGMEKPYKGSKSASHLKTAGFYCVQAEEDWLLASLKGGVTYSLILSLSII